MSRRRPGGRPPADPPPSQPVQQRATPSPRGRRWLSVRTLAPVTALLGIGCVVLGVLLALGVGGDTVQELKVVSCDTRNDPGCQLRAPTHMHADFAIFIKGKQLDFSAAKYVSTESTELSAVAHIHAPRFTVVHVHRTGTTWQDFFDSIKFKLVDPTVVGTTAATTCLTLDTGEKYCGGGSDSWKFYVNGVKVEGVAATIISDLDRVLLSYGSETDAQVLADQVSKVTDQACIPSERCKDRIKPDEPIEMCTASNDAGCVKPGG